MQKACDCGVAYVSHSRCIECGLLLHVEKKFCKIFNSARLVGYTVNGIRCYECVPHTNPEFPKPVKRIPLTPEEARLRKLESNRQREKTEARRKYHAERKRLKYQNDPIYREKQKEIMRQRTAKINTKYIDNSSKAISDQKSV